jgi:hypothetical protein
MPVKLLNKQVEKQQIIQMVKFFLRLYNMAKKKNKVKHTIICGFMEQNTMRKAKPLLRVEE